MPQMENVHLENLYLLLPLTAHEELWFTCPLPTKAEFIREVNVPEFRDNGRFHGIRDIFSFLSSNFPRNIRKNSDSKEIHMQKKMECVLICYPATNSH